MLKLPGLLLLWLVSEACQTSTSAWITFLATIDDAILGHQHFCFRFIVVF